LSIGVRLYGVVGALIAIPAMLAIQVFLDEFIKNRRKRLETSL